MRSRKILITGGAGFIGSHLAAALAPNNEVVVLDDLSSGSLENIRGLKLKFVKGSVLNKGLVARLSRQAELVFHLAAMPSVAESVKNPELCYRINVMGSLNVLLSCSRAKKFIFTSSAAVYGDCKRLPLKEQALPCPLSPYAASKLAVEQLCLVHQRIKGLPTVCLRLFNVYGPGQNPANDYSGVISKFIAAALCSQPLTVFGDGTQTRDFVFVGDVVEALIAAAETGATGVFNIAGGTPTSVRALASTIIKITNSKSGIRFQPSRQGDILHSLASVEKARRALGWRARVGMEEGLKQTLAWQKKILNI